MGGREDGLNHVDLAEYAPAEIILNRRRDSNIGGITRKGSTRSSTLENCRRTKSFGAVPVRASSLNDFHTAGRRRTSSVRSFGRADKVGRASVAAARGFLRKFLIDGSARKP